MFVLQHLNISYLQCFNFVSQCTQNHIHGQTHRGERRGNARMILSYCMFRH